MTEERIVQRIRKMLALANDAAATEGERDNALRMAHALLVKHNLSLDEVEQKTRDQEDPRGTEVIDSWSQPWAKQVFNYTAKLFFCKYYFGKKINATKCQHHFVGRASNTTTVSLMGEFLVTSILREARKLYVHNLAPESRSFACGAADRIAVRVTNMLAEATKQQDASPGTALVLADLYKTEQDANAAYLAEAGVALVAGRAGSNKVNANAYNAGKAYGNTVSLNNQVGASKARKQLT